MPGVLAPGQSVHAHATYSATQDDVDSGAVHNTAAVTGITPAGATLSATDEAVLGISQRPAITLSKYANLIAPSKDASLGDIAYRLAIENTGNVTLSEVQLTDSMPGLHLDEVEWPGDPGVLRPSEIATVTGGYRLNESDLGSRVVNTATVSGLSPNTVMVDDVATATRDVPLPPSAVSAPPSSGNAAPTLPLSSGPLPSSRVLAGRWR